MNAEDTDRAYLYWLFSAPGVDRVAAMTMLAAYGSAQEVCRHAVSCLRYIDRPKRREAFLAYAQAGDPTASYERIREAGISFTAMPLPDYPEKLRDIPDPPFGLTWIGRLPDPVQPAVAVVGARQCSEYGRIMAARFGEELGAAGIRVISGMAVGIDGLAQRGALRAGGESYALLAGGVDNCYPAENRELYEALKEHGGVISESPVGMEPLRQLFPARNRLISGFCDILLVIEARKRSGTSITVDMALEQGRDVFALPGRVTDGLSEGCNNLIRQGAGIATCAADLIDALRTGELYPDRRIRTGIHMFDNTDGDSHGAENTPHGSANSRGKRRTPPPLLSPEEETALRGLDLMPRSMDEIASALQALGTPLELPILMESLVDLCMKNVAAEEAGRFYRKGV